MMEHIADARKPYFKPEIVQEMDLETRAGSKTGGSILPGLDGIELIDPDNH